MAVQANNNVHQSDDYKQFRVRHHVTKTDLNRRLLSLRCTLVHMQHKQPRCCFAILPALWHCVYLHILTHPHRQTACSWSQVSIQLAVPHEVDPPLARIKALCKKPLVRLTHAHTECTSCLFLVEIKKALFFFSCEPIA